MSDDAAIKAGVDAARDAIKCGYQGRTLEHLVQIGIEAARPIIEAEAIRADPLHQALVLLFEAVWEDDGIHEAAAAVERIYASRAAVRTEPEQRPAISIHRAEPLECLYCGKRFGCDCPPNDGPVGTEPEQ